MSGETGSGLCGDATMPRDSLADSSRTMINHGRCNVHHRPETKETYRTDRSSCLEKSPPAGRNPSSAKFALIFTLNQNKTTSARPSPKREERVKGKKPSGFVPLGIS